MPRLTEITQEELELIRSEFENLIRQVDPEYKEPKTLDEYLDGLLSNSGKNFSILYAKTQTKELDDEQSDIDNNIQRLGTALTDIKEYKTYLCVPEKFKDPEKITEEALLKEETAEVSSVKKFGSMVRHFLQENSENIGEGYDKEIKKLIAFADFSTRLAEIALNGEEITKELIRDAAQKSLQNGENQYNERLQQRQAALDAKKKRQEDQRNEKIRKEKEERERKQEEARKKKEKEEEKLKAAQKKVDDFKDEFNSKYKSQFKDLPTENEEQLQQRQNELDSFDVRKRKEQDFEHNLNEYGLEGSHKEEYESERFDDKKRLEGISMLYRIWFPEDKELTPILDRLDHLVSLDVTAYSGYDEENTCMQEIEKDLKKLMQSVEKQELALNREVQHTLKKPDPENPNDPQKRVWYTDDEINADPRLKAKNEEFLQTQELLDKKKAFAGSLTRQMLIRKNGELDFEFGDEFDKNKDVRGREPASPVKIYIPSGNVDTQATGDTARENGGQKTNNIKVGGRFTSAKELPLFPHQPSGRDARQGGAVGDCYYIAALSALAKSRPDIIRKNMLDNEDGTVTVRLYGKSHGSYYPVYVKVDKVIPSGPSILASGATNCLWISCYEQALIASGLYAAHKSAGDQEDYHPVTNPEEVKKKYDELKLELDSGNLTQEKMKEVRKDWPWIFKESSRKVDNEYPLELVKWPSVASIESGSTLYAMDIIAGPDTKMYSVQIPKPTPYQHKITMKPQTPEQLCAIILANRKMKEGKYVNPLVSFDMEIDRQVNPLDFSKSTDDLFKEAYRISGQDPKNMAEARKEFDDMVRELKEAMEKDTASVTTENDRLTRIGKEVFSRPGHGGQDLRTIELLTEDYYTEEQKRFFEDIKDTIEQGLPITCGGKTDAKSIHGHHAYSVTGAFTDDTGRCFIKIQNPWGESTISSKKTTFKDDGSRSYSVTLKSESETVVELRDFLRDIDHLEKPYFGSGRDIRNESNAEKHIQNHTIDDRTFLAYTDALDKVCRACEKAKGWFGSTSEAFERLKTGVKNARRDMASKNGEPTRKMKEIMDDLSSKITAYEEHCAESPTTSKTRKLRVAAANELKTVIMAFNADYKSPIEYKKDQLVEKLNKEAGTEQDNIRAAYKKANEQGLIDAVCRKILLDKVAKDAEKTPYETLQKKLSKEEAEKSLQKMKPLVAELLTKLTPDNLEKAVVSNGENQLSNMIASRMTKEFELQKYISDAKKNLDKNTRKLGESMLDRVASNGKKDAPKLPEDARKVLKTALNIQTQCMSEMKDPKKVQDAIAKHIRAAVAMKMITMENPTHTAKDAEKLLKFNDQVLAKIKNDESFTNALSAVAEQENYKFLSNAAKLDAISEKFIQFESEARKQKKTAEVQIHSAKKSRKA